MGPRTCFAQKDFVQLCYQIASLATGLGQYAIGWN
jgi:hypothetical protein